MCSTFFYHWLTDGTIEDWAEESYEWLKEARADPNKLPPCVNAWQVLKAKFKQPLVNYAEHEQAHNELKGLKMKE